MVDNKANVWRPGVEPSNRAEAVELLNRLAMMTGVVPEHLRSKTPLEVLDTVAFWRNWYITSAKQLSGNLYASDSHFLYELIQNADDNYYDKAQDPPTLVLTLRRNEFILDSNEDGFMRCHVEAISSLGETTKVRTADQGYIGEKGIGFKSVFKVANKVHIKSEPYSFSFHYERDGELAELGMIAPLPQPYTNMPERGTQIILSDFHDTNFDALRKELERLPNALLLFLRKLTIIVIRIETQAGLEEIRWTKLAAIHGIQEIRVQKSTVMDTRSKVIGSNTLRFFVKQKSVEGLTPDSARRTSNNEFITNATIILAFPLDEDDQPYIEEQHTYAFLPMRKLGFSFLIQSDFVTQSSREDVVESNPRNKALRSRIPGIFAEAISRMCQHSSLKYTWMRYLPESKLSSYFWQELSQDIHHIMRKEAIFEPLNGFNFYSVEQLTQPISSFIAENGSPLLREDNNIRLLSLKYDLKDCAVLCKMGLSVLSYLDIVSLLSSDLKRKDSYWKSSKRTTLWRSKLSSLLSKICRKSTILKEELQSLDIIELENGYWTSTWNKKIYKPFSGPALVPVDLGLAIVGSKSMLIEEYDILVTDLGVDSADPKEVVDVIHAKHKHFHGSVATNASHMVSHFVYLFWHGPPGQLLPSYMRFPCSDSQDRSTQETGHIKAPGYNVHYLHDRFYQAVPDGAQSGTGRFSWKEWLVNVGGILDKPRISVPSDGFYERELAPELSYIIDYRPDVLIPLLKQHERFYNFIPEPFLSRFNSAKVLTEQNSSVALHDTILPTTELRLIAGNLGIMNPSFMYTGSECRITDSQDWGVLNRLAVIKTKDLRFFMACLEAICRDPNRTARSVESVIPLYDYLQREYKLDLESRFRETIAELAWICLQDQGQSSKWVTNAECLWQGPKWLRCKHVLSNIEQYRPLNTLFCHAVGLQNYSWRNALEELELMKRQGEYDFQKVSEIYQELDKEFVDNINSMELRNKLEAGCLILSDKGWVKPSACLWAPNDTQIFGRISIADHYSNIERFFVETLKVEKPNAGLHINALEQLAKTSAPFSQIKDVMENISQSGPPEDSLISRLQDLYLFLIIETTGAESMATLNSIFAIVDERRYASVFDRHVRLLDFSDDDFWKIKEFLVACGLKTRFLSYLVVEETAVDSSELSLTLTRNLHAVGYALLRYAAHYRSSRIQGNYEGLLEALRKITVYKSNTISKLLTIGKFDLNIRIPCRSADLHITEKENLCVFVPKDQHALERCWPSQLVGQFRSWLGVVDQGGDLVLQNILSRSKENKLDVLDDELEYQNIRIIEGVHRSSFASKDEIPASPTEGFTNCSTPPRVTTRNLGVPNNEFLPRTPPWTPSQTPLRTPSEQLQDDLAERLAYCKVLDSVIQHARGPDILDIMDHRAPMPSAAINTNAEELLIAFGQPYINGQPNWNRHKKVGAAGELFIVEILKRICGSTFTNSNWQSTMRHKISVHEKYTDLDRWSGRETSDIVYNHTSGILTQTLITCGHLDPQVWTDESANYYIEVKTTTGSCKDPFYGSSNQYSRMKTARLKSASVTPDIYVLMRVYNLGHPDELGLRIYVDPYSAKKRGELVFNSEKYTVVPGRISHDTEIPADFSDSDGQMDLSQD